MKRERRIRVSGTLAGIPIQELRDRLRERAAEIRARQERRELLLPELEH